MIVLNYHKVADESGDDFYTVSPATLARHLELIRSQGLQVVGVGEALAARENGSMAMLNFDDGTEDHFHHVFSILESERMKGVFFISTSKIGRPSYLSIPQIKEMAAGGHDIECHGHSHRRMDLMNPDELNQELASSIALIQEWTGRSPRILAPPGGFINRRVIETARRHGMGTIRTMKWNSNRLPLDGTLDCLVVTRATTETQIRKWLQGRGIMTLRVTYLVKQGIRFLLPFDFYLKIRSRLRGG